MEREKNSERRYLDTVEEDYQEEVRKKGREKGEKGEGSGRRQGKNETIEEVIRSSQRMALEDGFFYAKEKRLKGKTPYKDGIARRLTMKKKRKAGKKATNWQNNGKRSNIWKT